MTTEKQQELGKLKACPVLEGCKDYSTGILHFAETCAHRTPPEPAPAAGDTLLRMMSGAGEHYCAVEGCTNKVRRGLCQDCQDRYDYQVKPGAGEADSGGG